MRQGSMRSEGERAGKRRSEGGGERGVVRIRGGGGYILKAGGAIWADKINGLAGPIWARRVPSKDPRQRYLFKKIFQLHLIGLI